MGLRRPNEFTRRGRRLPGQSSDESLGLERELNVTVKVYGDAAVIEQQLVQIGDVSKGNYIELGPDGIKIYSEGAITEVWSNVDGGSLQTEFRVQGKDAAEPDAYVGMKATNYNNTIQNSFTLDTETDRATIDAEVLLIGEALRLSMITTTQRNDLTAVNGMIVYNLTNHKFQGYANGAWVDLH